MPDGNLVAGWLQLVLNGGALIGGAAVWKLYIDKLNSTIASKDAEISVAARQIEFWKDKASELEKRSPEVVERVLEERIATRGAEIARLAADRESSTKELERVEQEMDSLRRVLDQTKGFQQILESERPEPDDPHYEDYLAYIEENADRVVDVEVVYMGAVGVDSGQLLLTDPCYIEAEWLDEPFAHGRVYRDTETGRILTWNEDFVSYVEDLSPYGESPQALIEKGRLVRLPPPPEPERFNYSYNGACQATMSTGGFGELVYENGHYGAGVAFSSGWGDGFYEVWGEKHNGR
ncbi:MAG: hypothetical protein EOO27_08930, partial [Comamonadaceae bacterium]